MAKRVSLLLKTTGVLVVITSGTLLFSACTKPSNYQQATTTASPVASSSPTASSSFSPTPLNMDDALNKEEDTLNSLQKDSDTVNKSTTDQPITVQ